jgi:hypothetical protein
MSPRYQPVVDTRPWWRRWWLTALLGWLIVGAYRATLGAVLGTRVLWRTSFGRWRTYGWPVWVAVGAVAHPAPLAWLTGAAALAALPWARARMKLRRRHLSDLEAYLAGGTFAAVALAQVAAAALAAPWWVPLVVVVPPAGVWFWKRRIRRPTKFERVWEEHVAPEKDFAGTKLYDVNIKDHPDGPEGSAVIRAPKGGTGRTLARQDELLASHLAEGYPQLEDGAVVIARSPRDKVREARLLLCRPSQMGRIIPFEGPSLNPKTGAWKAGETGHDDALLHFWRTAGGIFTGRIGGPGAGKGWASMLAGVEAALSPLILPIFMDGKLGKGFPAMRHAGGLYCRTPAEWWVGWSCYMRIMGLRLEEEGESGKSAFKPTPSNPLLYIDVDEFRNVKKVWPQISGDAADAAEQHRASGGHVALNIHRGDADGWGETRTRGAFMSAGQMLLGPAGEVTAAAVATQDYNVDLNNLPPHPGWWYVCQRIQGGGDETRFHMLYLPPRNEVEDLGLAAPAGTVEDYLTEAVTPSLASRAQQAVWDEARELIESGKANDPDVTAEARHHAEEAAARATVDDQIVAALRHLPEGAGASQLADLGIGNRSHINIRLKALTDTGVLVQEEPGKPYRLADTTELEPAS